MIYNGTAYEVDGVLFDVDGTIWDSTGVVTDAWNKALTDSGFGDIQVTADRLKGLFGLPMKDIIHDILPDASEDEVQRFEKVCYEYEESFIREKPGEVYEGIDDAIKDLAKKYPVIIVSNCQSGYIELVMEHLKLEEYVLDHICPGDSGMLKAENIKYMCEKHDIRFPVYVGDTHMDEMACENAEVPIIFAKYGFGNVENPIATILKPVELLDIL